MESFPENTNTPEHPNAEQLELPLEHVSTQPPAGAEQETGREGNRIVDSLRLTYDAAKSYVQTARAERLEHKAAVRTKLGNTAIKELIGEDNPLSAVKVGRRTSKKAQKLSERHRITRQEAQGLSSLAVERMSKKEQKDRLKEIKRKVRQGDLSTSDAHHQRNILKAIPTGVSKGTKQYEKASIKASVAGYNLNDFTFGKANRLQERADAIRQKVAGEVVGTAEAIMPTPSITDEELTVPNTEVISSENGEQLVLDFDAEATPQTNSPSEAAESKTEDTKFDTVLAEILREEMLKEVETRLDTERQAELKNRKGFDKITRRQEIEKGLVDALVIKFFGKSSQEELEKDIPAEDRQKLRNILSGHTGTDEGTTEQPDSPETTAPEAQPATDLEKIGAKLSKRIGKIIASELKVAGKVDPMQRRKITRAAYDRVLSEHYGISTDELYENSPEDLDELFTAIEAAHAAFKKSRRTDSSSKRSGRQIPRSKQPAPHPASKNNRRNNSRKSHRNAGFQDSVLTNDIG